MNIMEAIKSKVLPGFGGKSGADCRVVGGADSRPRNGGSLARGFAPARAVFALAAATLAAAAFGEVKVSEVSARQRYPWNGLVDITCKVSGIVKDATHTNDWRFVFAATNTETSARLRMKNVTCAGEKATALAVTNGVYSLVWDASKDCAEAQYKSVYLNIEATDEPLPKHESVQLWEGGPYWATCNIGAENPEDYGYYFWWGDTVGYERVGNAWVATDGSSSNFSFGSSTCKSYNLTTSQLENQGWTKNGVLAPDKDAATAHWGDEWRMPTYAELNALVSNCDWSWTTENGVYGSRFKGRGAYAEESIFVPAAGGGGGSSLGRAGSSGLFWSSTPYSSSSYHAWSLNFYSGSRYTYSYYDRDSGRSVRAVSDFTK